MQLINILICGSTPTYVPHIHETRNLDLGVGEHFLEFLLPFVFCAQEWSHEHKSFVLGISHHDLDILVETAFLEQIPGIFGKELSSDGGRGEVVQDWHERVRNEPRGVLHLGSFDGQVAGRYLEFYSKWLAQNNCYIRMNDAPLSCTPPNLCFLLEDHIRLSQQGFCKIGAIVIRSIELENGTLCRRGEPCIIRGMFVYPGV